MGITGGRSKSLNHSLPFHSSSKPDASLKWTVIHGDLQVATAKPTNKQTNKQVMSHVTTPRTLRNVLQDYGSTCAMTPSSPKAVTWRQNVTTLGWVKATAECRITFKSPQMHHLVPSLLPLHWQARRCNAVNSPDEQHDKIFAQYWESDIFFKNLLLMNEIMTDVAIKIRKCNFDNRLEGNSDVSLNCCGNNSELWISVKHRCAFEKYRASQKKLTWF